MPGCSMGGQGHAVRDWQGPGQGHASPRESVCLRQAMPNVALAPNGVQADEIRGGRPPSEKLVLNLHGSGASNPEMTINGTWKKSKGRRDIPGTTLNTSELAPLGQKTGARNCAPLGFMWDRPAKRATIAAPAPMG